MARIPLDTSGGTTTTLKAAMDDINSMTTELYDDLLRKDRVDLRDFSGFDPTGLTDMSTPVQQWQDQAATAGYSAFAPPGVYGLGEKVTFKAPTIGAGGAPTGGRESSAAGKPYTMFKNLAINDNSWMIDISNSGSAVGGLLKGIRFHANGLNCSLVRVLGIESLITGGTPANSFWEQFVWDDIYGYGGYVNFEHYGYSGVISNVFSFGARLSAMRAYLSNALRVEGGWYSVTGPTAWQFELFGRSGARSLGESAHGITFNRPVFQSSQTGNNYEGNGLRIAEGISQVTVNAYFETHKGNASTGGVMLEVGCVNAQHPSPEIPIPVDSTPITGLGRPTNDLRYSCNNITLSGSTGGDRDSADSYVGGIIKLGNVQGVHFGTGTGLTYSRLIFSEHTHNVTGGMPEYTSVRQSPDSGGNLGGLSPTNTVLPGESVFNTTYTGGFTAGRRVYVFGTNSPLYENAVFETTVQSKVTNTSITISDPLPAWLTCVAGSGVICHNKSSTRFSVGPEDPFNRGGDVFNYMPEGNFRGTISTSSGGAFRGVKDAVFSSSFTDSRVQYSYDSTIRRNGRGTLKCRRLGSTGGGANGSLNSRVSLFPYGCDDPEVIGALKDREVVVLVSWWQKVQDIFPYNVGYSANTALYDAPYIGLTLDTTEGPWYPASQVGGTDNYSKPGVWVPVQQTYTFNTDKITKIGISITPAGTGYSVVAADDYSCWVDSLSIVINPTDYQKALFGKYPHHPESLAVSGKIHTHRLTQSEASSSITKGSLYFADGDKIEYTDPAAGGYVGIVCTTPGAGGTAVFKAYGVIAA